LRDTLCSINPLTIVAALDAADAAAPAVCTTTVGADGGPAPVAHAAALLAPSAVAVRKPRSSPLWEFR
jgi:hypothetical protein